MSPLRIAVLGAGKIGSTFAFQLARVGAHDVTVVARPGSVRLKQLRHDSGIVDVRGEAARVHVADALDEQVAFDLVIVTVLAYQVEALLPALRRCAAQNILFMFNTFEPERLRDAVGAERCAFGMPFVQANFDGEGRLNAVIGAAGQKSLIGRQRWVDVFAASGLPAVLEPDMPLWLRCHAPLCVAFESVSVAAMRRGGGAAWSDAMRLARGLLEAFALLQRLGYPPYPRFKARLARCPAPLLASFLWSLSRIRSFRELLATGEGECRALIEAMVAAAARVEPPMDVPRIQAMTP